MFQIYQIKNNYLLDSFEDHRILKAVVRHYLRMNKSYLPENFLKMEWLVSVLFFGVGLNLNQIADLVEKPQNQVKAYFFSGKHKLLIMENNAKL